MPASPPHARSRARTLVLALAAVAATAPLAPASVLAQQSVLETRSPDQKQDADFAKSVAEWTTKPEFMSPLVDHLPLVEGIPTPKDVLGYWIGAPKKLTYYADILRYYRALADASPRVTVMTTGKTDEGRETVVVFVADEQTIANLDQYKADLAKLADPRGLSEAQIKGVIAEAKPIYHVMGGLHSGETGPPEMLMELAYRLAGEDSPLIQQIRDNVIVSITPVAEPDGRDRYIDWYYRYLVDITGEDDRMPRPAVLGQVRPARQQPRHQLLAGDHADAARLVPALAPADHARHARVHAVHVRLQRPGAAEPVARPDPLRRAPVVRELGDGADDQVRHARRVDARLHGHVVAGLPGLHGVQPQRHDADVRDLRQRRREDDEARPQQRGGPRRHRSASGSGRCRPTTP